MSEKVTLRELIERLEACLTRLEALELPRKIPPEEIAAIDAFVRREMLDRSGSETLD